MVVKQGFTLVELLVVMAIISILAGLLVPGLQEAMASANKTVCAGNLKQWGNVTDMYAGDNDDYVFPSGQYIGSGIVYWPYYDYPVRKQYIPDVTQTAWNAGESINGCPAHADDSMMYSFGVNYQLSQRAVKGSWGSPTGYLIPHKRGKIKQPGGVVWMADMADGYSGGFNTSSIATRIGYQHEVRNMALANILFADMHVGDTPAMIASDLDPGT